METQRERDLIKNGYSFTGIYTREHEEAKSRAKKLREEENVYATVLTVVSFGKIYNRTGYSVYSKKKK